MYYIYTDGTGHIKVLRNVAYHEFMLKVLDKRLSQPLGGDAKTPSEVGAVFKIPSFTNKLAQDLKVMNWRDFKTRLINKNLDPNQMI
jgi:hypothetical protein